MGRAIHAFRSRKVRIVANAFFVTAALAAAVLTALHFAHTGWPLHQADPVLVAVAGVLFVAAYAFKAWGWQRLFPAHERPEALTLAAAGGAASVGGVALPGRFDEAIRIAVVRKLPGTTVGFGALAFLCASAASAALPIAPAGAATQAGAGAAILIVSGVPKAEAFAFAVAAQGMVILAGAAICAVAALWHLAARLRRGAVSPA